MGEKQKALEMSSQAVGILDRHSDWIEGADEDTYINHYHILKELGRVDEAKIVLKRMVDLVEDRAGRIREPEFRESFLNAVRQNRYALAEWREINR